jgi:hydrogenase maturation protease
MDVLVLGLGNILLGDEGVGVRVVETLACCYYLPPEVETLDGGTSGMDLLNAVAGRDHLIVADAVNLDAEPGSVVRIADDYIQAFFRTRVSPHQIGLSDLLAALVLLDEAPARVTIIGVVPEDLGLGTDLSPSATVACGEAAALVAAELRDLGLAVSPRRERVGVE